MLSINVNYRLDITPLGFSEYIKIVLLILCPFVTPEESHANG